jgi:hypothetical protein
MLLCEEEEREYTPIKNKTSTKRQKDRLLKKSVRFSFTDKVLLKYFYKHNSKIQTKIENFFNK